MHIAYTILFDLIFFHQVVLHPNFIDTHKSFTRYKYSLKKISCTPECIDEYFKYHIDVARARITSSLVLPVLRTDNSLIYDKLASRLRPTSSPPHPINHFHR